MLHVCVCVWTHLAVRYTVQALGGTVLIAAMSTILNKPPPIIESKRVRLSVSRSQALAQRSERMPRVRHCLCPGPALDPRSMVMSLQAGREIADTNLLHAR